MKVSEMISRLKELDPEMEIMIQSTNFELNNSYVSLQGTVVTKAEKKMKGFRDHFSGNLYEKEIFALMTGSGEKVAVLY